MIHLHTHSMYSLRDSIIKPDELADKLSLLGQNAVAITEHGNSLGGVSIYKILKKHNIKYIHGVEFYICDDVSVKDKTNKYYHLIALCKNDTGRLNLNRLITLSEHPDNKYYKPRIDFNILKQYSEGLIILSACLAGEVSRALLNGNTLLAEQIALKYKDVFGEDYYLEIQSRMEQDQIEINKQIISLAKKLNIEFVVTCDAHYLNKEDNIYQNKYAFNGAYKEDGESYVDCYIQSEDEVRTKLYYLPKYDVDRAINNTEYISSKCNVDMPLSAPIMPKIKVPSMYQDSRQWLIELCKQGFKDKLNIDIENKCVFNPDKQPIFSDTNIKTYIDRFEYELDALTRMGFVDYILLVYSYANKGKRRGIARGSGGGSLINYVTNITDIDPVEHKLYFERFIDVGALELLDNGEITKNELKIPDCLLYLKFIKIGCDIYR